MIVHTLQRPRGLIYEYFLEHQFKGSSVTGDGTKPSNKLISLGTRPSHVEEEGLVNMHA